MTLHIYVLLHVCTALQALYVQLYLYIFIVIYNMTRSTKKKSLLVNRILKEKKTYNSTMLCTVRKGKETNTYNSTMLCTVRKRKENIHCYVQCKKRKEKKKKYTVVQCIRSPAWQQHGRTREWGGGAWKG